MSVSPFIGALAPTTALISAGGGDSLQPIIQNSPCDALIGETVTCLTTGQEYTFGNFIGQGFFSRVYECRDRWGNPLAAKILKPEKFASLPDAINKATSEFDKLKLLRHPSIISIYNAFHYKNLCIIVTERCDGTIDCLFQRGVETRLWFMPIAKVLLEAINFMHINSIVHKDLHPGNVFYRFMPDALMPDLHSALVFRVGDLGVAATFNSYMEKSGTLADWIIPPEEIDSQRFGAPNQSIDVYHAGLLLLSVAYGRHISFTNEERLAGLPREMALSLGESYAVPLANALARHVANRTQTASEFWSALS